MIYSIKKLEIILDNYWTFRYGQDGKPTSESAITVIVDVDALLSKLGNPIWSHVAQRMTPHRLELSLKRFSEAQQALFEKYLLGNKGFGAGDALDKLYKLQRRER